jgi:perosamine synthetase
VEVEPLTRAAEKSNASTATGSAMKVPFFRPQIGEAEIDEVVGCLRSGWLTSGPLAKRFEAEFAAAVGGKHALALNSCTAALHVAVDALGLQAGQAVLVPTMTFAATAEVVRYLGAIPILVDCELASQNMDLADAERKLEQLAAGRLPAAHGQKAKAVGMIPVHVGGRMMDVGAMTAFARRHKLWVVEDAAHAFPAAWRTDATRPWQRCGENSSAVSCYSFYANKTITTGEGGMAVTDDAALSDRMRMMSLHGLSHDAWERYAGGRSWDYRIVEAGYKYNMTDVAAALGVHQLARAETMRIEREQIARDYLAELADVTQIELPEMPENRIHAWHLFPIRLRLEQLTIDRNEFVDLLRGAGVGCSVHWRPLHLHPYYSERLGWKAEAFPVASPLWERLISLPIFPGMQASERAHVVGVIHDLCGRHRR